ncbi:MAG TPA: hypothetical protein VFK89_08040 [Actinomycetota bacterium]|nr:hypothetical protein [Actinomycetota bacterium]
MREYRDETGIIVSWLVKIVLFFAVIGTVLFDAGSIVINSVTLDSSADQVAIAVSLKLADNPGQFVTDQQVYDLAKTEVADPEDGVAGAKVARKGTEIDDAGIVHVRLKRRARTLVTKYIGPLKHFTAGTGNGQASTD